MFLLFIRACTRAHPHTHFNGLCASFLSLLATYFPLPTCSHTLPMCKHLLMYSCVYVFICKWLHSSTFVDPFPFFNLTIYLGKFSISEHTGLFGSFKKFHDIPPYDCTMVYPIPYVNVYIVFRSLILKNTMSS